MHTKNVPNVYSCAKRLVQKTGIRDHFELFPICHGGNNRAWLLKTEQESFFLKKYFHSNDDKRDRFGTEISFLSFAWENGIRMVPEPIAVDRSNLLGLFSFIHGRRPKKEEIDMSFMEHAWKFLTRLNLDKKSLRSQSLPCASESCFSIAEHVELVERRFKRLISIKDNDKLVRQAKIFIKDELNSQWGQVKSKIKDEVLQKGFDLNKKIDHNEMILSPSDFGFHNTLLIEEGKLFFVDFEYAGWDDSAKLICDFFSQPEVPVPIKYFEWFTEKVSKMVGKDSYKNGDLFWRAKILFPLYRLKWCCIMLNDFIPAERKRKDFASFSKDRRKIQLDKAVNYFYSLHARQKG